MTRTVPLQGGWVFADERGKPIDPRRYARDFKGLCARAGVAAKRVHDMRHSAATAMIDSDIDLKTASVVLGHSRVAQTERYTKIVRARRSVAAARIDKALFGSRRAMGSQPCSWVDGRT